MVLIKKRSNLQRTAVFVGCLHILGSLWNIFGSVNALIKYEHGDVFVDFYDNIQSITVSLIIALTGFLLIIGAIKKLHILILPWLIAEGFGLLWYFVRNTIALVTFIREKGLDVELGDIAMVMILYSIIALCLFVWTAILSLYLTIRDEKQNRTSIPNDEEKLYAKPGEDQKPYAPYLIPVLYSYYKQTPLQTKY